MFWLIGYISFLAIPKMQAKQNRGITFRYENGQLPPASSKIQAALDNLLGMQIGSRRQLNAIRRALNLAPNFTEEVIWLVNTVAVSCSSLRANSCCNSLIIESIAWSCRAIGFVFE